ncbi:hypothetical protein AB8Q18_09905 [Neisseriaceae bacterium CLB008]|nr:hypothetical protein [Neisseriaceae bacterium]
MFEVALDEQGNHYINMTEAQLAQLSRTAVGETLFGCQVLRSDYIGGAVGIDQPFLANGVGEHVLVFQYKARLFGCQSVVRPDELPWDTGFGHMVHPIYDLNLSPKSPSLLLQGYAIKSPS